MALTKRQKLVTVVIESLETISTDSGFETNLGANVFDWETNFQEDDLVDNPSTSVCDLTAERLEDASEELDFFKLSIQIRTSFSSAVRAEDARKFIGDVQKAIRPLKDGFRNETQILANRINLIREGFELSDDGFKVAATVVEIEIIFNTQRFNAYE